MINIKNGKNVKKKKVIIIGGGTAGLIIAKNLQTKFDVVVLEKNFFKSYPLVYKIPLMIGLLFRDRNKKYILNREITLKNDRKIPFFESNILGGSSIMNGCVHMLGSKVLWDRFLRKFNAGYKDILESFEKLYTFKKGISGKINLSTISQGIIDLEFIKTLHQQGIPVGDMNFSDEVACGSIHVTTKEIFRSSVLSVLDEKKFKIFTREKVKKLVFNKQGKILGVITEQGKIKADYVILSGGVIGTCDLLLRSKQDKEYRGMEVLKNLSIGSGIKDHANLRVNVFTNQEIGSLNEIEKSLLKKILLMLKHLCRKPTLMKGTGASSGVHLDLDKDGLIDTRIQIVNFTESGRHGSDGKYFSEKPGFSFSISLIKTESKGELTLTGSSNNLNPRYLSSRKDVDLFKKALTFCLVLLKEKPLSDYVLEIENKDEIETKPEQYIANNIYSGHHLIGGLQNSIDSNFHLKETEGLYVCDASVFEDYVASNIHSSVALLADLFSKNFLAKC